MSTAAAIEVGGDLWNARVYAGLSIASELAAALSRPTSASSSIFAAWKIYWRLGRLNRDLDEILNEYDRPIAFPVSVSCDRIRQGRDILLRLHADCNRLLADEYGAALRTLTGSRLARLRAQSERILDVADWFDAMSTPEEVSERFKVAQAEFAHGDVVPWSAVR